MKMRTFWAAAAAAVGSCVVSIAILGVPGAESGGGTLKVYNWGEYIDEDVITQFEDETGISVVYDVFETNEEMYPVVEAGGVKYDVVCPSDYMIQRMIDNNMLAELDYDNIPNAKQIGDDYWNMSKDFDPKNQYAVPYCWGTVGILYNKQMLEQLGVPKPTSWANLWDPKLSDEILMQNSIRDAFMIALKQKGYSLNTSNPEELAEARDMLIQQKPLVQAYVIDQVRDKMINGEAAEGVIYSGEMLYIQEQIQELSKLLDLGEQSFDSFSLDYYSPLPWPGESLSPRENMEFIFDVCSSYARKFGRFYFRNLFLTGAPGLGKTFLSACIARTVSESGFSVVYDTAVNIFTRFEEQKFARDRLEAGEAKDETRRYLGCDLLILDDLGSELSTPFVQSALYTLINTRLTADKRTVISSNLTMDQVRARYTPQIASRLEGEYRVLPFYGEDIRLLRKQTL